MIEFQYFKGCPHAKISLQNLREVMVELNIAESDIRIIEVPSPEMAQQMNFQGSPTILIDGIDLYTGIKPDGFNYSCRVYEFDGLQTGVIPKDVIMAKLEGL